MVKKIKKRVPKAEPTPESLDSGVEGELMASDEGVMLEGAQAGDTPALSAASSLPGDGSSPFPSGAAAGAPAFAMNIDALEYQDGFMELAERIFSSVVAYWRVIVVLVVLSAGVWVFQSKAKEYATADLSQARVDLSAALNRPEALKSLQGELANRGLSNKGPITLTQLSEASARFDAAKDAEGFKAAGALFMKVGTEVSAEPMARAVAFQSAAAAYEQAQAWAEAGQAWAALAKLDEVIGEPVFGLHAQLKQAKVAIAAGDKAQAQQLIKALEAKHSEALKDPKNAALKREVTLTSLSAQ